MQPEDPVVPVDFACNICGTRCAVHVHRLSREAGSCPGCDSTVRLRSIVYLLSVALFGDGRPLADFPTDKGIHGIGLSDWDGYARPLAAKLNYCDTFFQQSPQLDIKDPPEEWRTTFDFVIASDVFEHVAPPIERAFAGGHPC